MSTKMNSSILASMPLTSSTKSPKNSGPITRYIETENVKIIHNGSTTLWRHRMTIDVIVVDHKGFDCLEVIFYHPDKDKEHRMYLCKNLLGTKFSIPEHEIEEKMTARKEPYIRQKKMEEFDEELALWDIKHDVMVAYINSRITIPSGLEENQFVVDLRPNFGDVTVERNGTQVLDVILEKYPEGVQPLKTKQKRKVSMIEISAAMQQLAQEQAAASQLTTMAVEHVHIARRGKLPGDTADTSLEALLNEKSPRLEPIEPTKLNKKGNSFKATQELAVQLCSGTLPGQDPANKPRRRGSVITAETFASRRRKTFDDAAPTNNSLVASVSTASAAVLPPSTVSSSKNMNMSKRQIKERQMSGLLSTSAGPMALSEEGPVLDEQGKLVTAVGNGNNSTESNEENNKESSKDKDTDKPQQKNKDNNTNSGDNNSKELSINTTNATPTSVKSSIRRRSFDGVMSVKASPSPSSSSDSNKKEKDSLGRAAKQRRGSARKTNTNNTSNNSNSNNNSSRLAAKFENLQEVSKAYSLTASGSIDEEGNDDLEESTSTTTNNNGAVVNENINTEKSSPMTSMATRRLESLEENNDNDYNETTVAVTSTEQEGLTTQSNSKSTDEMTSKEQVKV